MVKANDLEALISGPRFATYVALANGDRRLATELYEWTGELAGALVTDFRILEVIFRNLVDNALATYVQISAPHVTDWMFDPQWLPPGGHWWDRHAQLALTSARDRAGGRGASHDAIIAELMFGFWRYMVSGRYEESFWMTGLDSAFTAIPGRRAGERRRNLEQAMINLNGLRNRVAHHEPIAKPWARRIQGGTTATFSVNDIYNDLQMVLRWSTPTHATSLLAPSRVPALLAARPR